MSITVADLRTRYSADTRDLEAGNRRAQQSTDRTVRELRRARDEASRGGSAFGGFGGAASAAFSPIGGMVKVGTTAILGLTAATAAATAGAVALGASFVSAANELNAGFANVASLGIADARIAELKTNVQEMSIATGKTTDDLTTGLYEVISAFGDSADASRILEINARAAMGGVANTLDSIKLTSAVTKGYGDTSAEAVTKVSDLALKTVELGQTTFPELAASIGKVVPLSKELGISQEELFAVMATGSGVTGNAAEVSTQYRGILQSFLAPTKTATKLFETMGFATGEAMIQQLGFADSVGVMVQASERTGIPLQEFIGSIEGQTLALALAGAQSGKYQQNLLGMADAAGKTDAAFAAQTQGVNKIGFKLQQAANWWQVYRQKAGDAINRVAERLLPSVEPALVGLAARLEGFIPVVEAWANDTAAAMQSAFSLAGGGINGAVAALGAATGATVTVSANVTTVDWGVFTYSYDAGAGVTTVEWGTFTYSYDATSAITSVDWTGSLGAFDYTYDAGAGITAVNWTDFLGFAGSSLGFTYDAGAGITSFEYHEDIFDFTYDAGAGVTTVDFGEGLFSGNYSATSGVTSVLWGTYYHAYDSGSTITDIAWGAWTHTYNAGSQISETSVLWGAATHTYDAKSKIDEQSVLWGAWTHQYQSGTQISETDILWGAWTNTYDAQAQVGEKSVLWGLWTNTYDTQGNLTSLTIAGQDPSTWLQGAFSAASWAWPAFPAFVWPLLPTWAWPVYTAFAWPAYEAFAWPAYEAWAWPALPAWAWPDIPTPGWLNSLLSWRPSLPSLFGGSQPASNASGTDYFSGGWTWVGEKGPELLNLPRGSQIVSNANSMKMIGNMATGNTSPPYVAYQAGSRSQAPGPSVSNEIMRGLDQFVQANNRSAEKMAKATEKLGRELEGMLSKVPGLFGASPVTAQQMKLAELGVPQSFADDYLRRLTDEVVNGVNWEGVDIKDAAAKAGIDPSLPAQAILEMFTSAWNDSSLFAGGKNLDLFNQQAVQESIARQQASASGKDAIMALFGVTPAQAQGQAVALGAQLNAGITQGMASGASGGSLSGDMISNLSAGITPEAAAPIASALASSIAAALSQSKEEGDAEIDFGGQFVSAMASQVANNEALPDLGATLLEKMVGGWGEVRDLDFAGKLGSAIRGSVGSRQGSEALSEAGEAAFAPFMKGWERAARAGNYASSVADGVARSAPPTNAATSTPPPPAQARAASVGAASTSTVVNNYHSHTYTVNNPVDVRAVAKQVFDLGRRG